MPILNDTDLVETKHQYDFQMFRELRSRSTIRIVILSVARVLEMNASLLRIMY